TTGLYGLAVHPNPRPHLISLYQRLLHSLERVPASAAYRQSAEALARHRLEVVEKNEDTAAIEKQLDAGQIEELIVAAEHELRLLPEMFKYKVWEPLEEPAPEGQWEYFGNKGRSQ
ncbi:ETC complex I subunit conserved region-domain-containing protein, partial [Fimicolochytrium jonesii]|uniref:ETC complex I subunit conserved region-domain-containing protein n=1 Tax=Fimicolochytrium jonesii TaxID=1396493 RepID=UPI0022FDBFFF